MDKHQEALLAAFIANPDNLFSAGELSPFVEADRTTIFRHLTKMKESGMIIVSGQGRGQRYALDVNSDAYVDWDMNRSPSYREPVAYNPSLIANYIPNETFLFTDDQRQQMHAAAQIGIDRISIEPEDYRRILNTLIIDLSYASSRLENVDITWLDTKTIIEFGENPKNLSDTEMSIVLNHKYAIKFMVEMAPQDTFGMQRRDLFDLHTLLMEDLIAEPNATGRIRTKVVNIDGSKYVPLSNPHQISEEFDRLIDKVNRVRDPFEQAFAYLAFGSYLQPFQDGNKRTARLATNIPLIKNKLPPFSFADMARKDYMLGLLAVYERGRTNFLSKAFFDSYIKTAPKYKELLGLASSGGILDSTSPSVHVLDNSKNVKMEGLANRAKNLISGSPKTIKRKKLEK